MACCIGLMLFASCKKDPVAPTISIFNGSGYATENSAYYSGDEIPTGRFLYLDRPFDEVMDEFFETHNGWE